MEILPIWYGVYTIESLSERLDPSASVFRWEYCATTSTKNSIQGNGSKQMNNSIDFNEYETYEPPLLQPQIINRSSQLNNNNSFALMNRDHSATNRNNTPHHIVWNVPRNIHNNKNYHSLDASTASIRSKDSSNEKPRHPLPDNLISPESIGSKFIPGQIRPWSALKSSAGGTGTGGGVGVEKGVLSPTLAGNKVSSISNDDYKSPIGMTNDKNGAVGVRNKYDNHGLFKNQSFGSLKASSDKLNNASDESTDDRTVQTKSEDVDYFSIKTGMLDDDDNTIGDFSRVSSVLESLHENMVDEKSHENMEFPLYSQDKNRNVVDNESQYAVINGRYFESNSPHESISDSESDLMNYNRILHALKTPYKTNK